jgi:hypothetical protein
LSATTTGRRLRAAVFEQIHGAEAVVFDELTRTSGRGDTSKNTGIGRGIHDKVHRRQLFEVAGLSDIGMYEADTLLLQGHAVDFTARAAQMIKAVDFKAGTAFGQTLCQSAADKATNASDEYLHDFTAIRIAVATTARSLQKSGSGRPEFAIPDSVSATW